MDFSRNEKILVQTFSPLVREVLPSSAARCDAAFCASAEEFLPRHAAGLLRVQMAEASNNSTAPSSIFISHISLTP